MRPTIVSTCVLDQTRRLQRPVHFCSAISAEKLPLQWYIFAPLFTTARNVQISSRYFILTRSREQVARSADHRVCSLSRRRRWTGALPNVQPSRIESGYSAISHSDNEPLFTFHRWRVNLRVLEVEENKSIPHVPLLHPLYERLIGTIRRECLDQVLFWNASDLERKLNTFKDCYNGHRVHVALN
ncbi:MAG: integrase core domain-containing protein [Sulfuricaulis sp.]